MDVERHLLEKSIFLRLAQNFGNIYRIKIFLRSLSVLSILNIRYRRCVFIKHRSIIGISKVGADIRNSGI